MDYLDIAHCFGVIRRRSQAFVVEACEKLHLTYSEYALLLKLYSLCVGIVICTLYKTNLCTKPFCSLNFAYWCGVRYTN